MFLSIQTFYQNWFLGAIPGLNSAGEKCRTHQTIPMARPKCLLGDFTNLDRIYKVHQTNV